MVVFIAPILRFFKSLDAEFGSFCRLPQLPLLRLLFHLDDLRG